MSTPPPMGLKAVLKEVLKSKSGAAGFAILVILVSMSLYTTMVLGYDVVKKWNDPEAWIENPRLAMPEWAEIFIGKKLPRTMKFASWDTENPYITKSVVTVNRTGKVLTLVHIEMKVYYDYDDFPSELSLMLYAKSKTGNLTAMPAVTVTWVRPDGESLVLYTGIMPGPNQTIFLSLDKKVQKNIAVWLESIGIENVTYVYPHIVLFAKKAPDMWVREKAQVLKSSDVGGKPYRLIIDATVQGVGDVDAKFIVYGKVFGWAGTDDQRRDIGVALMWGAPVALAFGLTAAVSIALSQTFFGAVSGWFGGIVDEIIQRWSDVMLMIPVLPILMIVSLFYRLTIWQLLLVLVPLSLVGGMAKTVRSMVLQIKEEAYIEAAIAYGAGDFRIILRYIIPRVMPYVFASIVVSVPGYVFLEAALSFLGLGDPMLPTWGKLLNNAYQGGALMYGYWWWIALPVAFIMLTASAFALLGYAFDKVVNPRLRER